MFKSPVQLIVWLPLAAKLILGVNAPPVGRLIPPDPTFRVVIAAAKFNTPLCTVKLLTDKVLPEGDSVLIVTEPVVNVEGWFNVNVATDAGKFVIVIFRIIHSLF